VVSARPLNFRAVTRFFDGAPGAWSVVISHAGMTDTLIATDPSRWRWQAQTLVVLGSIPGRVIWRLVPNRTSRPRRRREPLHVSPAGSTLVMRSRSSPPASKSREDGPATCCASGATPN